ncbi:MAG TPA: hypothetical protein HA261_13085 [Methanosarcina sp.]|nr:hypothetical protein [Methanosarcina sp.]
MQYSLGIDAGGTYTDAVLIRDSDGITVDSSLMSPDKDFLVFAPGSRLRFETYSEALETATEIGKKLVEDYMKDCGLSGNQVEISIEKKTVSPDGWNYPPMETNLLVVGVGMRELHV